MGKEYVQKKEVTAPKPTGLNLKKRQVFAEYQDHNEHFKLLTRDMTPVSIEDNICLSCRENLINTVCFIIIAYVISNRFLCRADMQRYVRTV